MVGGTSWLDHILSDKKGERWYDGYERVLFWLSLTLTAATIICSVLVAVPYFSGMPFMVAVIGAFAPVSFQLIALLSMLFMGSILPVLISPLLGLAFSSGRFSILVFSAIMALVSVYYFACPYFACPYFACPILPIAAIFFCTVLEYYCLYSWCVGFNLISYNRCIVGSVLVVAASVAILVMLFACPLGGLTQSSLYLTIVVLSMCILLSVGIFFYEVAEVERMQTRSHNLCICSYTREEKIEEQKVFVYEDCICHSKKGVVDSIIRKDYVVDSVFRKAMKGYTKDVEANSPPLVRDFPPRIAFHNFDVGMRCIT